MARRREQPAVMSSESPGRKQPMKRPVSAKTMATRRDIAAPLNERVERVVAGEDGDEEVHSRAR
jgi:hypothetical protein